MKVQDYADVYGLWGATKGVGLHPIDDSYEAIVRYVNRNPHTCFVAKDKQEEIVGVILCGHDGRRGYIYHTAVVEVYRKHGVGSDLVKHALTALKKEGIRKAALVAFQNNYIGNTFWEKQGFIIRDDLYYRNLALDKEV